MSLGVVIKCPEGIVLATDTRLTLTVQMSVQGSPQIPCNFDGSSRLLTFAVPYIGAVTYGLGVLQYRTPKSLMADFEATIVKKDLYVEQYSIALSNFFMEQFKMYMPGAPHPFPEPMTFVVSGINPGQAYGKVFLFDIPNNPKPVEQSPSVNNQPSFGITWGGQGEYVWRLMAGYDQRILPMIQGTLGLPDDKMSQIMHNLQQLQLQVPIATYSLQDSIDLASLLIRTTIEAERLSLGVRSTGGEIEIAAITSNEGLFFVQKKKLHGE